MDKVVIDSSVFSKVFLIEEERELALDLLSKLNEKDYTILVPSIFIYEVMAVLCRVGYDLRSASGILTSYRNSSMSVIDLDDELISSAWKIVNDRRIKTIAPDGSGIKATIADEHVSKITASDGINSDSSDRNGTSRKNKTTTSDGQGNKATSLDGSSIIASDRSGIKTSASVLLNRSHLPSFYDSVYHALAIRNDCSFVTDNAGYYNKASAIGNVEILSGFKV